MHDSAQGCRWALPDSVAILLELCLTWCSQFFVTQFLLSTHPREQLLQPAPQVNFLFLFDFDFPLADFLFLTFFLPFAAFFLPDLDFFEGGEEACGDDVGDLVLASQLEGSTQASLLAPSGVYGSASPLEY